ncbi:hypothetical protein H072_6874 [Dactylellina haptotyla CBS 200.50]|uniref:G domain-containing protein n=1 Tax=Dactylellina haptotyla (strain CBS 200.50) TaxID=1284197 RepID=S8BJ92_DACHA|nr:hypothetical protein H072_6874 [Dactylellina haptotyla CBS 200.50]
MDDKRPHQDYGPFRRRVPKQRRRRSGSRDEAQDSPISSTRRPRRRNFSRSPSPGGQNRYQSRERIIRPILSSERSRRSPGSTQPSIAFTEYKRQKICKSRRTSSPRNKESNTLGSQSTQVSQNFSFDTPPKTPPSRYGISHGGNGRAKYKFNEPSLSPESTRQQREDSIAISETSPATESKRTASNSALPPRLSSERVTSQNTPRDSEGFNPEIEQRSPSDMIFQHIQPSRNGRNLSDATEPYIESGPSSVRMISRQSTADTTLVSSLSVSQAPEDSTLIYDTIIQQDVTEQDSSIRRLPNVNHLLEKLYKCKRLLESIYKDTAIQELLQDADANNAGIGNAIITFLDSQIESAALIGFLGEHGSGKSTLFNALLDVGDLIPTAIDGNCAPIATEFTKSSVNMPAFTIEIEYITQQELEEEARALWVEMKCGDLNSQEGPEDPTSRQGKAAINRFYSLFPGFKFKSLANLLKRIRKLYHEGNFVSDKTRIIRANDKEKCATILREYIISPGKEEPDQPEIWTVIKRIRVYLDSEILSAGSILIDIPGLDDSATRTNLNQEYIPKVQNLIIVVDARNILDDKSLKKLKQLGYEEVLAVYQFSLTAVLTFSDKLFLSEVSDYFKEDASFQESLRSVVLRQQDLRFKRARARFSSAEAKTYEAEILQLEKTIENIRLQKLEELFTPRTKIAFSEILGNPDLSLEFFETNAFGYLGLNKDTASEQDFKADLNRCTITKLREFIRNMPYSAQHRLVEAKLNEAKAIIGRLSYWAKCCTPLQLTQWHILDSYIKGIPGYLEKELESHHEKFSDSLAKILKDVTLATKHLVPESMFQALDLLQNTTDSFSIVKAVCLGGGEVYASTNWNAQFLLHLKTNLSEIWRDIDTRIFNIIDDFRIGIIVSITAIRTKIISSLKEDFGDIELLNIFDELILRYGARASMIQKISESLKKEKVFERLGDCIIEDFTEVIEDADRSLGRAQSYALKEIKNIFSYLLAGQSLKKTTLGNLYGGKDILGILQTNQSQIEQLSQISETINADQIEILEGFKYFTRGEKEAAQNTLNNLPLEVIKDSHEKDGILTPASEETLLVI